MIGSLDQTIRIGWKLIVSTTGEERPLVEAPGRAETGRILPMQSATPLWLRENVALVGFAADFLYLTPMLYLGDAMPLATTSR
jgi:hypothetical protein